MNIALFCRTDVDELKTSWGFSSIENEGIGGSEQAALRLAESFVKGGHQVTIYQHCKSDRTERGILFKSIAKAKKEVGSDTDLLIIWRDPSAITDFRDCKKPKRIVLWLHDMIPVNFVGEYYPAYDKIVVASEFHKQSYKKLPLGKFVTIPLGVDVKDHPEVVRKPMSLLYTSNYDRGLEILLINWQTLKARFPDLTLTICYGWDTWLKLLPTDKLELLQLLRWKEWMDNAMDKEGITVLGKVSQNKVWELLHSHQIFAYPCTYPETFCLSVVQAQAAACLPVVIPTGAVAETCQWGIHATIESYTDILSSILIEKDFLREEQRRMSLCPVNTAWDEVAHLWEEVVS